MAIYQSNPPDDVAYVLEDSGATLAFVEDDAQLAKFAAIAARVKPRRLVAELVDAVDAKHASYEPIKRFVLLDHEFTQENGELTPTLKVQRKLAEQRYRDVLDGLYTAAA